MTSESYRGLANVFTVVAATLATPGTLRREWIFPIAFIIFCILAERECRMFDTNSRAGSQSRQSKD